MAAGINVRNDAIVVNAAAQIAVGETCCCGSQCECDLCTQYEDNDNIVDCCMLLTVDGLVPCAITLGTCLADQIAAINGATFALHWTTVIPPSCGWGNTPQSFVSDVTYECEGTYPGGYVHVFAGFILVPTAPWPTGPPKWVAFVYMQVYRSDGSIADSGMLFYGSADADADTCDITDITFSTNEVVCVAGGGEIGGLATGGVVTVIPDGSTNCFPIPPEKRYRQARLCSDDSLVDVWMLSAAGIALGLRAFQVEEDGECLYFDLDDSDSLTPGTLYTSADVTVWDDCDQCAASLCTEPCATCAPCYDFCPTERTILRLTDWALHFYGCADCAAPDGCCVIGDADCDACGGNPMVSCPCDAVIDNKPDCDTAGGTWCCGNNDAGSDCQRYHPSGTDLDLPLTAWDGTTMTFGGGIPGITFTFNWECGVTGLGNWTFTVTTHVGTRNCSMEGVIIGDCNGFSGQSDNTECEDLDTTAECGCVADFTGEVIIGPCPT